MGTSSAIAHLYRRAGFGASPDELAAATGAGYSSTVEQLIAGLAAPDPVADAVAVPSLTYPAADQARLKGDPTAQQDEQKSLGAQRTALVGWWLGRMVAAANPLQEKLTLLLHGQFPTAVSKVRYPVFMYGQNQLFRTQGPGNFTALTQAVATDPAMLIWLDAASDKATSPNENFSRELMERFTMGIGTYTQADVQAAAYAFTGWRLNLASGDFTIDRAQHSATPQTFLGQSGVTTGTQVIDIVTNTAASAKFIPAALWSHLAYPVSTTDPVVSELAPGYAADHDLTNLLQSIFTHPKFTSTTATTGLVKQPIEYVVGTLRALGVTPAQTVSAAGHLEAVLAGLGQVPFDPPSVGGWPQNEYWLSTAASLMRWQFAERLTAEADISAVTDVAPSQRVEATANLLSLQGWSSGTAEVLGRAVGRPSELVTLALVSPEYVLN